MNVLEHSSFANLALNQKKRSDFYFFARWLGSQPLLAFFPTPLAFFPTPLGIRFTLCPNTCSNTVIGESFSSFSCSFFENEQGEGNKEDENERWFSTLTLRGISGGCGLISNKGFHLVPSLILIRGKATRLNSSSMVRRSCSVSTLYALSTNDAGGQQTVRLTQLPTSRVPLKSNTAGRVCDASMLPITSMKLPVASLRSLFSSSSLHMSS